MEKKSIVENGMSKSENHPDSFALFIFMPFCVVRFVGFFVFDGPRSRHRTTGIGNRTSMVLFECLTDCCSRQDVENVVCFVLAEFE